MKKVFWGAFMLLFLLAGCSSSRGIETAFDYNPEADFSPYQTFSWISDKAYIQGDTLIATSSENYIQAIIRQTLEEKGFAFIEDRAGADFLVSYSVGSRSDLNFTTVPSYFQVNTTWARQYWRYPRNVSYNVNTGSGVQVKEYVEGQLAIDVFDRQLKQPVWHGTATKQIKLKHRKDPKPALEAAVSGILGDFPPER